MIEYIKLGCNNYEIAKKLYISSATVRAHVSNILIKTNSKNRTNLIYNLMK
ncbi:response regulator transcription factor [bacterium]|nr:response regulator transcription factor [bacterium]